MVRTTSSSADPTPTTNVCLRTAHAGDDIDRGGHRFCMFARTDTSRRFLLQAQNFVPNSRFGRRAARPQQLGEWVTPRRGF